jgi:TPR repeat protein
MYGAAGAVAKDQYQAVKWLRLAAEKGDADAQQLLGYALLQGQGCNKDEVEAAKWLLKAADQDHAMAQNMIGYCYNNGFGVSKDPVEAVRWYIKAAEQGNPLAQLDLGVAYANGVGVAKDLIESYAYLNLAGVALEDARKNLRILESQMPADAQIYGQQRTKELKKKIEGRLESIEELRKAAEKEKLRKGI